MAVAFTQGSRVAVMWEEVETSWPRGMDVEVEGVSSRIIYMLLA